MSKASAVIQTPGVSSGEVRASLTVIDPRTKAAMPSYDVVLARQSSRSGREIGSPPPVDVGRLMPRT